MSKFIENIMQNVTFVLEFLALVMILIAVAYVAEKLIAKKNGVTGKILTVRKIAMIGMFAAISGILMLFEVVVPFAPSFYKIDLSELPVYCINH